MVYALGEIVYDIIFRNSIPETGSIGGSMLNTCVTLGRLGLPVSLISYIGTDKLGNHILSELKKNGVETRFIYNIEDRRTNLSLAFLNSANNAEYEFFKDSNLDLSKIIIPDFYDSDIVVFGSSFAINEKSFHIANKMTDKAQCEGALILYDPNMRSSVYSNAEVVQRIKGNIKKAHIVRASNEDVYNISGNYDFLSFFYEFCGISSVLIVTNGNCNVQLFSNNLNLSFPVPQIETVSTIGAGDTFNAGILYGLGKYKCNDVRILNESQWTEIINLSISFASDTCMSNENFVSLDFVKHIMNKKNK